MALLRITKGNYSHNIGPLLLVFIISICLDIGMCLQVLMKFYNSFKILMKMSIQKPRRITKGNNSNNIVSLALALRFLL